MATSFPVGLGIHTPIRGATRLSLVANHDAMLQWEFFVQCSQAIASQGNHGFTNRTAASPNSCYRSTTMTGPSRKRFLTPDVLEQAARDFFKIAQEQGIQAAIAGGYALQFFGSTRLTVDLDIIADRIPEGLSVKRQLSFGGIETELNGTPTDAIVRNDDFRELYEAALSHRIVDPAFPGPVVALEYMVAIKMAAGRTKDDADLEWIVTHAEVDMERTRRVVREHLGVYAAREFDAFVAEARWRAARDDD